MIDQLKELLAEARFKAIKDYMISRRLCSMGTIADAISEGFVTVQGANR